MKTLLFWVITTSIFTTAFTSTFLSAKPRVKTSRKSKNKTQPQKAAPQNVRVLLTKFKKDAGPHFYRLESDSRLSIDYITKNKKRSIFVQGPIFISATEGSVYLSHSLNNTTTKIEKAHISSKDKHLSLNGTEYSGTLSIVSQSAQKPPLLINTVALDDYIYSVLRYEIYQSWPMEMQKVQAIASRTYALYHILDARKRDRLYDLQSSNFHQRYDGTHEYKHLRTAVKDTKGMILTYKGKPALAMFDACCGGIKAKKMKHPLFDQAPYLARKKQCAYCSKCSLYEWNKTFSAKEMMELFNGHKTFRSKLRGLGKLKEVRVSEADKAGIVHTITMRGSQKSVTFKGDDVLDLLRPTLRSLCFTITEEKNSRKTVGLTFEGRGFGHLLGLCQHGAKELVTRGWHYRKILDFYYPGTSIARLKDNKPTTRKRRYRG